MQRFKKFDTMKMRNMVAQVGNMASNKLFCLNFAPKTGSLRIFKYTKKFAMALKEFPTQSPEAKTAFLVHLSSKSCGFIAESIGGYRTFRTLVELLPQCSMNNTATILIIIVNTTIDVPRYLKLVQPF